MGTGKKVRCSLLFIQIILRHNPFTFLYTLLFIRGLKFTEYLLKVLHMLRVCKNSDLSRATNKFLNLWQYYYFLNKMLNALFTAILYHKSGTTCSMAILPSIRIRSKRHNLIFLRWDIGYFLSSQLMVYLIGISCQIYLFCYGWLLKKIEF